jgi:hypothetical protein
MDKRIIIVANPGHNNGEFTAWLLNHSPDCPHDHRYLFTPYIGFLGIHYRISDEWNFVTINKLLFEIYLTFDRAKPPEYKINLKGLKDFVSFWKACKGFDKKETCLVLYVNCFDGAEIFKHKKELGIDAVIKSYWNMPELKERHFYATMEFDPTSTNKIGENNESITDIKNSMMSRHEAEIADNENEYDFIVDQSKIHNKAYVLDIYDALDLERPNYDFIKQRIDYYYELNRPVHEYCFKLNKMSWTDIIT